MNILILGATGFIGSVVAARLVADGHTVIGLGRNPARARLKQPALDWRRADLSRMKKPADWDDILKDQHVVVNCAGALQDGLSDDLSAAQAGAMLALYSTAKRSSRPLIVQISARTAEPLAIFPSSPPSGKPTRRWLQAACLTSSCALPSFSAAMPTAVRRCCGRLPPFP